MKESLKERLERLKSEKLPDSKDNALSSLLSIPTISTETIVEGVNPDNQEIYDEESLFGTPKIKKEQEEFSPEILELNNPELQVQTPLTKPEIIASITKQLHNLLQVEEKIIEPTVIKDAKEGVKNKDVEIRDRKIKKALTKVNRKGTLKNASEVERELLLH